MSQGLAYIDNNGHAIIKVDNTTNGAGDSAFGRNTVYLISQKSLTIGSLLLVDANHIPFGVRSPFFRCFPLRH